jgi:two-component system chemotaxis sensor kinase CheA
VGDIVLKVYEEAGNLIVEVSDDGRGINPDEVLQAALNKNLITPEQAMGLSLEQIYKILLLPGFSTTKQVSRISGRGVGLNIVKSNVDKMGGKIEIASELGRGTKIQLIIPVR